jgi:hypothetical protein
MSPMAVGGLCSARAYQNHYAVLARLDVTRLLKTFPHFLCSTTRRSFHSRLFHASAARMLPPYYPLPRSGDSPSLQDSPASKASPQSHEDHVLRVALTGNLPQ